jgi:hypothetical protein
MLIWPGSKAVQTAIAAVGALVSAGFVVSHFAMTSFNNFYYAPHKAYPYPYADVPTARMMLYRDCAITMLGIFVVLFTMQRIVAARTRD